MTPGTVTLIVLGVRTSTPRTTNTTGFVVSSFGLLFRLILCFEYTYRYRLNSTLLTTFINNHK